MRKRAFVSRVAARTRLPRDIIRAVLAGIRAELADALGEGEDVIIDGLGGFRVARQNRRVPCRLTGATESSIYVSFRASEGLKHELREHRDTQEVELERLRPLVDRLISTAARRR